MTDREIALLRTAQRLAYARGVTLAAADMLGGVDLESTALIRDAARSLESLLDRVRAQRSVESG